jgi:carbamoyl-phosphate synthase large subunit
MNIAISGLNNTDNPAPGIGVAKSLKWEHNLIGLSYDPNEPGVYQEFFKNIYLMPYPALGYDEFKNRLTQIKEESDIDIIIPNLDAELPLYIKYQDDIKRLGIKTYLPSLECFEARDKSKLAQLSKELGIKHPKTIEVSTIDELKKATEELDFPVMVKGNYYKAYKANSLDEAIEHFYTISNEWGFPLLIQEVISGVEINFIGIGNGNELIAGVGMKKLTTTELGKVWSAVSIKNPKLLEVSEKFVTKLGWRGAFEFEAMSDGKDIYLIEINPRFPAWVYFSTMLGVNLPQIMIDLIEGKEVEKQLEYESEKMYVRFVDETLTDFKRFKSLLTTKKL